MSVSARAIAKLSVRRTVSADLPACVGFGSPAVERLFAALPSLRQHVAFASQPLTVLNGDRIVAVVCFSDAPAALGGEVDPVSWEESLADSGVKHLHGNNTLWLSWFGSDGSADEQVLVKSLRALFRLSASIQHVALTVPKNAEVPDFLQRYFVVEDAGDAPAASTSNNPTLAQQWADYEVAVCSRASVLVLPTIRPAKLEDYDDLVPVMNSRSGINPSFHDTYFVAQLIERNDENNRTFVADVNGTAIGLMHVTTTVDVKELSATFMLARYGNLEKDGGKSNAVCITLFALDAKYCEYASAFLPQLCQAFPDFDFIAITLPHNANETYLLSEFSRVEPRHPEHGKESFPHALFVVHRNSMSPPPVMEIVEFDKEGSDQITAETDALVEAEAEGEEAATAKALIRTALSQHAESRACVLLRMPGSGKRKSKKRGKLIGVAVVNREANASSIRASFDVESFVDMSVYQAEDFILLEMIALRPEAEGQRRHLLTRLARKLRRRAMIYLHECFDSVANSCVHESPTLRHAVADMHPLKPRQRTQYFADHEGVESDAPQSAFLLSRGSLFDLKLVQNARIVVVGSTSEAVSALEQLAFVAGVRHTGLVYISPLGFPKSLGSDGADAATSILAGHAYSDVEHAKLGLKDKVRELKSTVIGIDRDAKRLTLENGALVDYDFVLLAPGLHDPQYDVLESSWLTQDGTGLPPGVFETDSIPSAQAAFEYVEALAMKHDAAVAQGDSSNTGQTDAVAPARVLVVGGNLVSFGVVAALLERGLRGSDITHAVVKGESTTDWPNKASHFDGAPFLLDTMTSVYSENQIDVLHARGSVTKGGWRGDRLQSVTVSKARRGEIFSMPPEHTDEEDVDVQCAVPSFLLSKVLEPLTLHLESGVAIKLHRDLRALHAKHRRHLHCDAVPPGHVARPRHRRGAAGSEDACPRRWWDGQIA
jgi:Cilia- and flagella-associated protein 61, N-terminal domain